MKLPSIEGNCGADTVDTADSGASGRARECGVRVDNNISN